MLEAMLQRHSTQSKHKQVDEGRGLIKTDSLQMRTKVLPCLKSKTNINKKGIPILDRAVFIKIQKDCELQSIG